MEKELHQLDLMVSKGNILEAFKKFFHKDVVTWSHKKDKTTSKKQKEKYLVDFFDTMKSLDECKFHGSLVVGNTSYSKFTFLFTHKDGQMLKWHEIIRRKWDNGLVVDEFYYQDSFADLKKKLEKKELKKKLKVDQKEAEKEKAAKAKVKVDQKEAKIEKAAKVEKVKVAKVKTEKVKTPKAKPVKELESLPTEKMAFEQLTADQNPIDNTKLKTIKTEVQTNANTKKINTKIAPKTVEKTQIPKALEAKLPVARVKKIPDLTIIEGIGPKIKELLALDGITTFDHLAKSKAGDIKNILLTRGGTRYNANNPTTWPEQAALAAAEKWEELKALKAQLKFGKRV